MVFRIITKKIGWFFIFITVSITGYAQTKVVVIPLLGDDAPRNKSVFLTKERFDGDLGGPEGADEKCQAEADAEGSLVKNKEFKAWVSSRSVNNYSASTRVFNRASLPYRLVGGDQIAPNYLGLVDGELDAAITRHADGKLVTGTGFVNVWTGVKPGGDFHNNVSTCNNWTSSRSSDFGVTGGAGSFNSGRWTDLTISGGNFARLPCNSSRRLYCFEQ